MPDPIFVDPRLVQLYDAFDGRRDDLDLYGALSAELGARSVLDVGCGTGTLAVRLAAEGLEVVGVDPAAASLEVARAKPGGERVRWRLGEAAALPPLQVDLVTMTGNVAQVLLTDEAWSATLRGISTVLRPAGHLAFEVRDPARRAWDEWTPACSRRRLQVPGVGAVEGWVEVTDVALPLVSFRWSYRFELTGETLVSDSTLRFRDEDEVRSSLVGAGFEVVEVRDAPDRPGHELVFLARRRAEGAGG